MEGKTRIGVIFGGRSGEHEISLRSAESVIEAIDPTRYEVVLIGIGKDGGWKVGPDAHLRLTGGSGDAVTAALMVGSPQHRLMNQDGTLVSAADSIDVYFPVLHGTLGEDGTIQGLLEMAEVAYVGSGVAGSSLCMDKGLFKAVAAEAGLPILPYVTLLRSEIEGRLNESMDRIVDTLGFPVFSKPANLGSSVGVVKATNRETLRAALLEAARWDRRIVVEQGVDARELEVAVLGNDDPQASVVGEIVPDRDFYDYDSKYADSASTIHIPAPISSEQSDTLREMALKAFRVTDCAGLGRVDFLMERQSGRIWLNEINTLPGFTAISMYPKLWEATGLSYSALLDRLVELARERHEERRRNQRDFSA